MTSCKHKLNLSNHDRDSDCSKISLPMEDGPNRKGRAVPPDFTSNLHHEIFNSDHAITDSLCNLRISIKCIWRKWKEKYKIG